MEMFEILVQYFFVLLTGMFRLYVAAGLSFLYNHSAVEQWFLMSIGSVLGVSFCLLLGRRIENWWLKRTTARGKQSKVKRIGFPSLVESIWHRYGLFGLAAASVFLGTIPIVAIALVSGLNREKIFWFLSIGKLSWVTVIVVTGKTLF